MREKQARRKAVAAIRAIVIAAKKLLEAERMIEEGSETTARRKTHGK